VINNYHSCPVDRSTIDSLPISRLSASSLAIGLTPHVTRALYRENFMCRQRKRRRGLRSSPNLLSRPRPSLAHSAGSVAGGTTGQAEKGQRRLDAYARPEPGEVLYRSSVGCPRSSRPPRLQFYGRYETFALALTEPPSVLHPVE